MKRSTPGIIVSLLLSHRAVEVLVIDLGLRRHVRLQHRDFVIAQKRVHRVVGILEVHQLARAGGAILAAGSGQTLGNAVVADGALVHGFGFGLQIAAAVGAGLHAVAAAQAVLLVHQHHAVRADEGGAHRADLHAGGIRALVAELGDEEALEAGLLGGRKAVDGSLWGTDSGVDVAFGNFVALYPGAEIVFGNLVLIGAGAHAVAATDALIDIDDHAPPVVGHAVGIARRLGAGDLFEGCAHARNHEELAAHAQYVSTGDFHRSGPGPQRCGLCGLWHSLQAMPPECSAVTTCGNVLGFAVSFSWHRAQRVATTGSLGMFAAGSSACLASGP